MKLLLALLFVPSLAFSFDHKLSCEVTKTVGKMRAMLNGTSNYGVIVKGDIAKIDTSLESMYMHPSHKLMPFFDAEGNKKVIYSCSTATKKADTEMLVVYDDSGYEDMRIVLWQQGEGYKGLIHNGLSGDALLHLDCEIES